MADTTTLEKSPEDLARDLASAEERVKQAEDLAKQLQAKVDEGSGDDLAASALRKKVEETEEELTELRKEKRMRGYIEKAADYSSIADPERLGVFLEEADRVLSDDNQDFLTKLLKAAKSASEVEETSKIFEQLSSVEVETEGWDVRLEKRAKEIADSQNISIEQAKVKVMDEDPELRAEYNKAKEKN